MIEIEQLAVLDLCAWTGSQYEAARILNFNQSSISRNLLKAKAVLSSVGIECLRAVAARKDDAAAADQAAKAKVAVSVSA